MPHPIFIYFLNTLEIGMLFSKVVCTLDESKEFFSVDRYSISRSLAELTKHSAIQLHFAMFAIKDYCEWREVQLMHERVYLYTVYISFVLFGIQFRIIVLMSSIVCASDKIYCFEVSAVVV